MADIKRKKVSYIAGDLVMLGLLLINLGLILFDWLFHSQLFRDLVFNISPVFYEFYDSTIHADFILYDLAFILIFLTEFFVRWIISLRNKEFAKWYYYPFVYWYDLVGCIPIGGFRFLRLLRIVTIIVRLQRIGWLVLENFGLYRFIMHYFNLFIQEVTDRVTLTILSNVREELEDGTPVIDRIVDEVLRPRQAELTQWVSARLQHAVSAGYAVHEDEIKAYVHQKINDAVEKNKELRSLEVLPVMGRLITRQIEDAIKDIVFGVVHGIIRDLSSPNNKAFIEDLSDLLIAEDPKETPEARLLNLQVADILSESISVVIDRVKERKWTPRELAEAELRMEKKVLHSASK
ncbi:MAG: hypothetical protein LAT67_01970 [Balneolales bacterium]|nr:hypothetical protein [Balneolales bacterium]